MMVVGLNRIFWGLLLSFVPPLAAVSSPVYYSKLMLAVSLVHGAGCVVLLTGYRRLQVYHRTFSIAQMCAFGLLATIVIAILHRGQPAAWGVVAVAAVTQALLTIALVWATCDGIADTASKEDAWPLADQARRARNAGAALLAVGFAALVVPLRAQQWALPALVGRSVLSVAVAVPLLVLVWRARGRLADAEPESRR